VIRIVIAFLSVLLALPAEAQLSGNQLAEIQFGKLPNEAADPFVSLYDRLVTNYFVGDWQAGLTLETFTSPFDDRSYFALSQGYVRYQSDRWKVKAGNLYETIGRGLLLRSFEVQGAILEDIGFRSRNYFHKDILGLSAQYQGDRWDVQLLAGQVLNNVLPPTFDRTDRRPDDLYLADANVRYYKKHSIGGSLASLDTDGSDAQSLTSLRIKGPFFLDLNYHVEWARNWTLDNSSAIYTNVSGAFGDLGVNIEYKRYRNFILGTGINEPPALIKQHTYRVLNRSTHVSNPASEEGYQIDVFYTFENGATLSGNHAVAINRFGTLNFTFSEYFVEWSSTLTESTDYKVFIDWAQDPLKGESDRISIGTYWSLPISSTLRIGPEVEYQRFSRDGSGVDNQVYALGLKIKSKWTATILWESTSDPFLVDEGSRRHYLGGTIRFRPTYQSSLQLFVGERRGGPACSGGICYEILDFRGVEGRWTQRF